MHLTTYELEHLEELLKLASPSDGVLNTKETRDLTSKIKREIAARDRATAENNIEPGVRATQYRVDDKTVITRYEKPSAAHGVSAPKSTGKVKVSIDSVDTLLMLLGTGEDLIPND